MSNLFEDNGALFSPDKYYRYRLWRIWDKSLPLMMYIGLNPSTANEADNDPTITRVRNFTRDFGYGGFYMMNLFAMVSSKPKALLTAADPLGDNDRHLEEVAATARVGTVVFAWGAFKEARKRSPQVVERFPDAMCLGFNGDRSPKHPLFLSGDTRLEPFVP